MIGCKGASWVGEEQLCPCRCSALILALGRAQWYSLHVPPSAEVSVNEYCSGPQCPSLKVSTVAVGVLSGEGYLKSPVHFPPWGRVMAEGIPLGTMSNMWVNMQQLWLTCRMHIKYQWLQNSVVWAHSLFQWC